MAISGQHICEKWSVDTENYEKNSHHIKFQKLQFSLNKQIGRQTWDKT